MSICVHVEGNPTECATHGLCNCVSSLLWKIEQETGKAPMTNSSTSNSASQCFTKDCFRLAYKGGFCQQCAASLGGDVQAQASQKSSFLPSLTSQPLTSQPLTSQLQQQGTPIRYDVQQQQLFAQQHLKQQEHSQQQQAPAPQAYYIPNQPVATTPPATQMQYQARTMGLNVPGSMSSPGAASSYWKPNNFEQFKQDVFKMPGTVNDLLQPFALESSLNVPVSTGPTTSNVNANVLATKTQVSRIPPSATAPKSFMESLSEAVGIPADSFPVIPAPVVPTPVTSKKSYKACVEPGCKKYAQRQGLCRMHEKIRNGEPINTRPTGAAAAGRIYRMCCYPDCEKHSQKYHVCRNHEKLLIEQARKLVDQSGGNFDDTFKQLLARIKTCRHPSGCTNTIKTHGLCMDHLPEDLRQCVIEAMNKKSIANKNNAIALKNRKKRLQEAAPPRDPSAPRVCLHMDCENIARSLGYCKSHERAIRKSMSRTESGKILYYVPAQGTSVTSNSVLSKRRKEDRLKMRKKSPPMGSFYGPSVYDKGDEFREAVAAFCNKRGCSAAPTMDGMCDKHYIRRCDVHKCNRKADKKGRCLLHRKATLCQNVECNEVIMSSVFCKLHSQDTECTLDGCTKPIADNGSCADHQNEKRCDFEPCNRFAVKDTSLCKAHENAVRCSEEGCDEWTNWDTTCEDHDGKGPPPLFEVLGSKRSRFNSLDDDERKRMRLENDDEDSDDSDDYETNTGTDENTDENEELEGENDLPSPAPVDQSSDPNQLNDLQQHVLEGPSSEFIV